VTEVHTLVKDIMIDDVATVRSDASYREMTTLLRARRVSGLPVVDAEGIVVGVVSETDLLTRGPGARAGAVAAPQARGLCGTHGP
jgi:CBS domain-containing protein